MLRPVLPPQRRRSSSPVDAAPASHDGVQQQKEQSGYAAPSAPVLPARESNAVGSEPVELPFSVADLAPMGSPEPRPCPRVRAAHLRLDCDLHVVGSRIVDHDSASHEFTQYLRHGIKRAVDRPTIPALRASPSPGINHGHAVM